ncbi:MAG: hypothetical protein WAL38_15935, partial [Solirubrobacteraceae bacterium]
LIAAAPDDHRHHPFERFNVQTSEQSITTNNSATTPKTSGAQHRVVMSPPSGGKRRSRAASFTAKAMEGVKSLEAQP